MSDLLTSYIPNISDSWNSSVQREEKIYIYVVMSICLNLLFFFILSLMM